MRSAFWIGLVVGVAVGAVAGMAYAPKSGEETREQLGEGVRKVKDAAADKGRRLLHRGRVAVDETMDKVEEQAARV